MIRHEIDGNDHRWYLNGKWIASAIPAGPRAVLSKPWGQYVKKPMWIATLFEYEEVGMWTSFCNLKRFKALILKKYPGETIQRR